MIHLFQGKAGNEVWLNAIEKFICKDDVKEKESNKGKTFELLHCAFSIEDPKQRWIQDRNPAINPIFALLEVIWIISGSNDAEFLNYWNRDLPKYAGTDDTYYGAYGFRLRSHLGFDQLDRAYHILKNNPDTRQVVLQIWDANFDLPNNDGQSRNPDIPCNVISLLKVDHGKLEWSQIIRSNDIFLGVPYNFNQFTTLQEIMAGWLNLELGSYNQYSDSLHVYDDNYGKIKKTEKSDYVKNSDSLKLDYENSKKIFSILYNNAIRLQNEDSKISEIYESFSGPISYKNILLLICAEAARKRRNLELSTKLMSKNTNQCFKLLWSNWIKRWSQ